MRKYFFTIAAILYITSISKASPSCQIKFKDSFNKIQSIIKVSQVQDEEFDIYTVTNPGFEPVKVIFHGNQMVGISVGAPITSRESINTRYHKITLSILKNKRIRVNKQITWEPLILDGCDETGVSIIQFLVDEWFYYG